MGSPRSVRIHNPSETTQTARNADAAMDVERIAMMTQVATIRPRPSAKSGGRIMRAAGADERTLRRTSSAFEVNVT